MDFVAFLTMNGNSNNLHSHLAIDQRENNAAVLKKNQLSRIIAFSKWCLSHTRITIRVGNLRHIKYTFRPFRPNDKNQIRHELSHTNQHFRSFRVLSNAFFTTNNYISKVQ